MNEQDEISRIWFDLSQVSLEADEKVFNYFDEEALIALSGPVTGSKVTAEALFDEQREGQEPVLKAIRLQVHHPAVFSMIRFIRVSESRELTLENAKFRIRHDYAGRRLAARSLTFQARAAQGLGFKNINLDAVGDYNMARFKHEDDRWVGYWVWPRLGFDADIPGHVLAQLPVEFKSCRRVSELMGTQEGQDWWELHGDTLNNAKFDLTADSVSWRLLAEYKQRRNIKV